MQAQTLLDEVELEDRYQAACEASELNKKARSDCIYQAWITQPFYSKSPPGTTIVTIHPTADGGMPHTRVGSQRAIICIPVYWPESKVDQTIKHELVHIDQKKRPAAWREKLLEEGWAPVEETRIPLQWLRRCRINPDTFKSRFWAWGGRHVPLPLFVREDSPDLRSIETRWYDLQEERVNPSPPFTFTQRYGKKSDSEMEHPYELYAYLK